MPQEAAQPVNARNQTAAQQNQKAKARVARGYVTRRHDLFTKYAILHKRRSLDFYNSMSFKRNRKCLLIPGLLTEISET